MRLRPAPPLRGPYAGARAAEGPLTLGQRNILQWVPDVDDPVTVYLPRIVELPGTVSVAEVAGALSTLLARHGYRATAPRRDAREPRRG